MSDLDPLSSRVLAIQDVLNAANIPAAFGGAIVLFFYGEPRTTGDIDLNIFVPASKPEAALQRLATLHAAFGDPAVADLVRRDGQVRVDWAGIPVDIFFANLPFLESAATRARTVPFAGSTIRVLSPEDLVVCKAMFNRRKDWADIEQLLYVQQGALDLAYVRGWLVDMVGEADKRTDSLDELIAETEAPPGE